MSRGAFPRMADMQYVRVNHKREEMTIIARITDGPQSEIGRAVHVRTTPADLPALRALVTGLEARQEREARKAGAGS